MSQPRPNLFLIGSMKSGTTYLSQLLADHPAIFISSPKEPCHFVDGEPLRKVWPEMWKRGYWQSEERYLALFAEAGAASVVAEASMVYSYAPIFAGVPARILALSPEARFIYIMRDPVERAISHYWHRVRWWGERRPILAAIRADSQYTDVSHYSRQLEEYLRHVELARIYVLTYEELLANPVEELSRLYAWLKVNPAFRAPRIGMPVNERPEVVDQARGFGLLDQLRRSTLYARIGPYAPRTVRKLGTRLAVRRLRPAEVPIAEVERYLRPRQQRQTYELSVLLNRDFAQWTTLHQGSPPRQTRGLIPKETASAGRGSAG
jgi:hypothetical protein